MQSLVIQVRRVRLRDVEAKVLGVRDQAEVILLVHDIVLGRCNDTSALDTLDGLGEQLASKDWIRTEAFPVPATLWRTTKGSRNGLRRNRQCYPSTCQAFSNAYTELNIYALSMMLVAHGFASSVGKFAIPGSTNVDTCRENRVEVCHTNTGRGILQTETTETKSWNASRVTYACLELPTCTSGQVDLLSQCKLAHEIVGPLVCSGPVAVAGIHPW